MESHLSPKFKKWMKKCVTDEFSSTIDENLNGERDPYDVAQKIINSREMTELTNAIRTSFVEQIGERVASRATMTTTATRSSSAANSRPQTSLSYVLSDLSEDDWVSVKGASGDGNGTDEIGRIVEQIGHDKPDHVRLAGYEALLKNEPANAAASNSGPALLKALRDALIDGSRSVFEASLLVHAKLLNCPRYLDAYANLLSAFADLYRSKKLSDTLPTILSGVNFKVFLHEKLFRVMRLITDHHEEVLKGSRTTDKLSEDMIGQFVSLLSSHTAITVSTGSASSPKRPLSALQIVSVLDPRASWSKKWMHGLITRKVLCSAITKSPGLLKHVVASVKRGLENPPAGVAVTMSDEPAGVFVSGDSVEAFSFLHCLNLLCQLCATATGRALLSETRTEEELSAPDFLASLLGCLNGLAFSDASNALYETVRAALSGLLSRPVVLYDARFYQVALSPLAKPEVRLWPHTLDVLSHMLDTPDGPSFMMMTASECRAGSAAVSSSASIAESSLKQSSNSNNNPVVTVIAYAANLLRQPVAVMSAEHVTDLFRLIGKIFRMHEIFRVTEDVVRQSFYPSLTYMYGKLDRYYIENEIKTQCLVKAVREMMMNLVSIPLGLQMLSNEPLIFEELIRGSIAPVRASWSAYDVIGFVANSGFLARGAEVLTSLAPHVLSTLLAELGKKLEDPREFYDPWESDDVKVFLHVLALFSLNAPCFLAFMMMDSEDEGKKPEDENEYVKNLPELFQRFADSDSPYHYLGLSALKILLWNLDVYLFLVNLLDFQQKLLQFQEYLVQATEEELSFEAQPSYVVDECSMLRHSIIVSTYYVRHKRNESSTLPEEVRLFSKLPPPHPLDGDVRPSASSESELEVWLSDCGPVIRDNSWILGTRRAHRASPGSLASHVLLNLLDQMEKAIPTVEWVEGFKWDQELRCSDDYWLPEEKWGIDLVMHYASINGLLENTTKSKGDLKIFIQSAHCFINYSKPERYGGFDWFLATVFLICSGDLDKAKTFVNQILHFPSVMFMWPALEKVMDGDDKEESYTRLLFAHLLESIISLEFPTVKFALKWECGMDWWMICDRLLTQCFMGILPWSEIVHYFAISILYSPDYILYYCVSLLSHCESDIVSHVTKGSMWPENMVLEDYRCHSQIGLMDRLGKRYGGKVLLSLTQRKLSFSDVDFTD
ncbi:protein broad-minded-like [Copidosoma floridanum]|uniref:protein broad-minded-like n=1 Tax=Copidosoma floridanum TaxID=29053 RepID=UPI0006C98804|nr:protein broad-minded-like [Copidosoma floridanum]